MDSPSDMPSSPVFRLGEFVGQTRRACTIGDIAFSHRIASGDVAPHSHDDAHFVWVTGGTYLTSARGDQARDQPVFVYNPAGTFHRDRFEGGTGSFFTISISARRERELAEFSALPSGAIHVGSRMARDIARAMLSASWSDPTGALDLEALTVELMDSLAPENGRATRNPPPWLSRARELLHDCCADNLVLTAVASQVGVHPVHLTRAFRTFFRTTPGEFLRACRLERAAQLLTASGMPLSNVALASGFADQSHFSKRFRAAFGLPPGEYRELTRHRPV